MVEYKEVDVDLIEPIPENIRAMDDEEFAMLVRSIEENGFVEPIQVVEMCGGGYRIVNGQHRFEAATKVLGFEKVPVVVLGKMCCEGEKGDCWGELRYWQEVIRLNNIKGDWLTPELAKRVLWLWEYAKKKMDKEEFRRSLGFRKGSNQFKRIFEGSKRSIARRARAVQKTTPVLTGEEADIVYAVRVAMEELKDVYDDTGVLSVWYGGREVTVIKATPELKQVLSLLIAEGGDLASKMAKLIRKGMSCGGKEDKVGSDN